MPKPHRLVLSCALLFSLLCGGCVARFGESNLIKPVDGARLSGSELTVLADGRPNRVLNVSSGDATLYGVVIEHEAPETAVLYFGGNRFTIRNHLRTLMEAYSDLPATLIVFDHRGYGGSGGSPGIEASLRDALVVFDSLDPHHERLIVHGQSFGSFLAAEVAANREIDGVVLESSTTTVEDWVNALTSHTRLIRRVEIDEGLRGRGNLTHMDKITSPLVVLVGSDDRVTPPELASRLFEASPLLESQKRLIVADGKGHDDAALSSEFREGLHWLLEASQRRLTARIEARALAP